MICGSSPNRCRLIATVSFRRRGRWRRIFLCEPNLCLVIHGALMSCKAPACHCASDAAWQAAFPPQRAMSGIRSPGITLSPWFKLSPVTSRVLPRELRYQQRWRCPWVAIIFFHLFFHYLAAEKDEIQQTESIFLKWRKPYCRKIQNKSTTKKEITDKLSWHRSPSLPCFCSLNCLCRAFLVDISLFTDVLRKVAYFWGPLPTTQMGRKNFLQFALTLNNNDITNYIDASMSCKKK